MPKRTRIASLLVAPDATTQTIALSAEAENPEQVQRSLRASLEEVHRACGDYEITLGTIRTRRSESLSKGMFQRNQTWLGTLQLDISCPLKPSDGHHEREAARARLHTTLGHLEDKHLTIGQPRYEIRDPEQHRAALLQQLKAYLEQANTMLHAIPGTIDLYGSVMIDVLSPTTAEAYLVKHLAFTTAQHR